MTPSTTPHSSLSSFLPELKERESDPLKPKGERQRQGMDIEDRKYIQRGINPMFHASNKMVKCPMEWDIYY